MKIYRLRLFKSMSKSGCNEYKSKNMKMPIRANIGQSGMYKNIYYWEIT